MTEQKRRDDEGDDDDRNRQMDSPSSLSSVAVMAQLPLAVTTATPRVPRGTSRSVLRAECHQRAVGAVVPVRLTRCPTNTQNTAACRRETGAG